jgi:hypothetical protein
MKTLSGLSRQHRELIFLLYGKLEVFFDSMRVYMCINTQLCLFKLTPENRIEFKRTDVGC